MKAKLTILFILLFCAAALPVHVFGQCAVWDADSYTGYCVLHTDPVLNTRVAIGVSDAMNLLDVNGGVVIGDNFAATVLAPTNGLAVEGRIGAGLSSPVNLLDVEGGAAIGASYSGTSTAPANGLIVQGNTGIGTASPLARLHVSGGSVLFDGTSGVTPASGAGTRFMWIPAKSAIRAGSVSATAWDDANIGSYSTAFGYNTIASGSFSVAMGGFATASGSSSVALGGSVSASGSGAFAGGLGSSADGEGSVAIGYRNVAKSNANIAIGLGNEATGEYTIGIGVGNVADGLATIALGYGSRATGKYPISIGDCVASVENGAAGFGHNLLASGTNSFVIGSGCSCEKPLENKYENSLMIGFASDAPTVMITGNNNCEEKRKPGRVGIQTVEPTHTLHVVGDARISERLRIGTQHQAAGPNSDYVLSVDGKIVGKSLVITNTGWADFVFADDYQLMPLNEVERIIKRERSLPGIPTESEVESSGVSVGDMQVKLLQKVEELTLYAIDQEKRLSAQNAEMQELRRYNEELRRMVEQLNTSMKNDKE